MPVRPMTLDDYGTVAALLRATPGVARREDVVVFSREETYPSANAGA